jgi:hypothetical protein
MDFETSQGDLRGFCCIHFNPTFVIAGFIPATYGAANSNFTMDPPWFPATSAGMTIRDIRSLEPLSSNQYLPI